MIVRRYGRRTRCGGRGFSDADLLDGGSDADEPLSLSQEPSGSQPDPYGFAAFSSQDSSPWSLDSDIFGNDDPPAAAVAALPPLPPLPPGNSANGPRRPKDRKGVKAKKHELPPPGGPTLVPRPTGAASATATLMEAQEFGEMMEDVDEVNFALDGLRAGQPARIRQASLLSLLTICATAQRRRFLRAQGTSKRIIDAIVGLNIDDSASSLAAAALFYVLASDATYVVKDCAQSQYWENKVPDDCLMDSPSCIHFLLKLLNPPAAGSIQEKVSNIGRRVLGISNTITLNGINKRVDSCSTSIMSKVEEILLSCKELKPGSQHDEAERPELCSKWIALLTLEKACLSTVSIEDTSGTVSRVGGNFKERLRELGGLDTIFSGLLKNGFPSVRELKSVDLQSIMLLLKCFKIMENATFLSKENQDHLLQMTTKVDIERLPLSFVRLVIRAIKSFSDLSLNQTYPCISVKKQSLLSKVGTRKLTGVFRVAVGKDGHSCTSSAYSHGHCGTEGTSYRKKSDSCQKRQRLSTTGFEVPIADSGATVAYSNCDNKGSTDVYSSKARTNPHPPVTYNGKFVGSRGGLNVNSKVSNVSPRRGASGWISINLSKSKINSVTHSPEHFTTSGNGKRGNLLNGSNGDFSMNSSDSKISFVHLRKRDISTVRSKDECMGTAQDPFTFDEVDWSTSELNGASVETRLGVSEETKEKCTISTHDPFAFDEDELGPSKWEMLATRKEAPEKSQSMFFDWELENGPEVLPVSDSETTEEENKSSDNSCRPPVEEDPNLLEDCLLSAVKVKFTYTHMFGTEIHGFSVFKDASLCTESSPSPNWSNYCSGSQASVQLQFPFGKWSHTIEFMVLLDSVLMNLTNDNPVGCQQIALCGGLDTLASLITNHFPSFNSFQPVLCQLDESASISKTTADAGAVKDKYLSDYELDFLVAILGLLVNLVEKDIQNRSRLASASVSMAHSGRPEDRHSRRDVISLLCSIFLANRSVGEVTGEENLPCDEDAFLLQGEREAEMMIIEAYSALLLAFLSTESFNSRKSREAIASCLPDHSLEVLVPVLERFVVGISRIIKHDISGNPFDRQ
ncbi:hypothetical protein Taro_023505 [Colocasia esculenta]|uniref:Wings apart-like protein C-terminal domain-containing protein n=1 Tax=Colocasia esculenta TaxID=4460 RepID=A0A843VB12_COLES|nr:hypothetical protein [Colocasia esculenta]